MNHKNYVKEFFRNNKWNTFLTILVYIAGALVNILVSWYLKELFDLMAGTGLLSFRQLVYISIAMISGVFTFQLLSYFTYPSFLKRAMSQYKSRIFDELLKKNLSSFSKENTATYLSALTNDALSIEQNYLQSLFEFIRLTIMFVASLSLMLYYNVALTFIAIAISAIPLAVSILTANSLAAKEKIVSDINEQYVATSKDILNGFAIVKSFKAENEIQTLFDQQNDHLEKAKESRNRTEEIIRSLGTLASIFAQFGVMMIGAWFVIHGRGGLTAGMILAFTNLMNFVLGPIASIPQIIGQRKAAIALVDKVATNLQQNISDEGIVLNQPLHLGVKMTNVSYSYDGQKAALSNINYLFEKGKAYAIVGGSGSGKSTLLNLLMGSDMNFEGDILLDKVSLKDISMESLYEMISLIQQHVFIFDATIEENITMFRDFPKEEINRVIHLSGLDELIKTIGADYKCGENGNKLSGGEKQRIAIARSLLKHSEILVVDEATSALDNQTAYNISQAILNLDLLTRIVVTHRLDAKLLRQYDEILVLRDGRLIETGTFDDLMAAKEFFYSLYTISNE